MFRKICMLISIALLTMYPLHSFAAHPFKTKHANAFGKGNMRFLMEGAAAQVDDHKDIYSLPITAVTYSFGDWTLMGVQAQYKFINHDKEVHSTSGVGDATIFFRHTPFHLDYGHIGAQVGVKIPTANDDRKLGTGETDYELTLIHSYFGENIITHINCGVEVLGNPKHRSSHEAVFSYSAVAVFPLHKRIKYFVEVQGRSGKSVFKNKGLLRSGLIIPISHGLELGYAGGVGLTNNSPDWEARLGIYWTWQRGEEIPHH